MRPIVEAMIRGLTKMSWERVDIDFSGTKQRLLAHSTIQASFFFLFNLTTASRKNIITSMSKMWFGVQTLEMDWNSLV